MMDEDLVFENLEAIKEVKSCWWKLKWKPIKNGTYDIYITKHTKMFGIRFWKSCKYNGWGRRYDGFAVELGFWWTLNIWVHFNFIKWIIKTKQEKGVA